MKLAITGTPGVGKTTVADLLKEEDYDVLDLNEFIKERGLRGDKDDERDTFPVDIHELIDTYPEAPLHDIVEGHLSHYLGISRTVVLRCDPNELKERVRTKDWHEEKRLENIEAEMMDVILSEAMYECEDVYEIDTTDKTPDEVKNIIVDIFEGKVGPERYRPGSVDWTGIELDI